jgi:cytidylate kinase
MMPIITISRQRGSSGTAIGQAVAERLNYEHVDKVNIGEALAGQGLPALEVEKYDEKRPSFWESFSSQRTKFLHLIQAVIYDFARRGNTLIVGRGGQVLLKDLPGALHVRVVAPFDVRLKRIMEQEGHNEKDSERMLHRGDRDSAGYIKSVFGADWDDQTLYDVVINTKTISVETGTKMIIDAISSSEFKESSENAVEKLTDLALLRKVEARLMDIPRVEIPVSGLSVEKGVVTLVGTVVSAKVKEDCERAISGLDGVNEVKNQLQLRQRIVGT